MVQDLAWEGEQTRHCCTMIRVNGKVEAHDDDDDEGGGGDVVGGLQETLEAMQTELFLTEGSRKRKRRKNSVWI